MSKKLMMKAKELIDNKQYAEAREILVDIDHPTAEKWIAKIDSILSKSEPKAAPAKVKSTTKSNLILGLPTWAWALIAVVFIIAIGIVVFMQLNTEDKVLHGLIVLCEHGNEMPASDCRPTMEDLWKEIESAKDENPEDAEMFNTIFYDPLAECFDKYDVDKVTERDDANQCVEDIFGDMFEGLFE